MNNDLDMEYYEDSVECLINMSRDGNRTVKWRTANPECVLDILSGRDDYIDQAKISPEEYDVWGEGWRILVVDDPHAD